MNNSKEFENKLSSFNLVEPSDGYVTKGQNIISDKHQSDTPNLWNRVLAVSLMISIGINVALISGTEAPVSQQIDDSAQTSAQKRQPTYSIEYGVALPGAEQVNQTLIWERRQ